MNKFGGSWTEQKIQIVTDYARAYLKIMAPRKYWKLLYFDGFAGTGDICTRDTDQDSLIAGAARRILEIYSPRPFDIYYFVEKDQKKAAKLDTLIKKDFSDKRAYVVPEDCNKKLHDLSSYLKSSRGKNVKALAFIDPCGMQLNWESIQCLQGLSVDTWVLVPLGMGVNRLLTKDGIIEQGWLIKLQQFLGMLDHEIVDAFYEEQPVLPLYGKETERMKKDKTIEIAGKLYRDRLKTVFKFVSKPFLMANAKNSLMYHFLLGSNNETAVKIADDVVGKWSK